MKIIKGEYRIQKSSHGTFIIKDGEKVKRASEPVINKINEVVDYFDEIELSDEMMVGYADYITIFDKSVRMYLKTSKDRSDHLILERIEKAKASFIFLEERRYQPKRAMMHYDLLGKPFPIRINDDMSLFTDRCRKEIKQFIETKKTLF